MRRRYSESIDLKVSPGQPVPLFRLPPRFISAAIDSSLIIGGYWWDGGSGSRNGLGTHRVSPLDLDDLRLIELSRHLGLGYLRIGGTEADRFYYRMKKKDHSQLAAGYGYALPRSRWDEIVHFAEAIGSRLCMTLNAGPGARKSNWKWRKKNARALIHYSRKHKQPEAVWELGNEVNAYIFFHGLKSFVSNRRYAGDISRLSRILKKEKTGRIAGPAAIVWPVLGETLPFLRGFLKSLNTPLDILTWHYYPQQSSRCPFAVRRAKPKTLLSPKRLDSLGRNARRIQKLVLRYTPDTEVWMGETGHALCGGEPGISDRFASSLWWMDALGQLARTGHHQVVRQTLIGGDYGLLRKGDGLPNPDYWATLIWNRYMGPDVFLPVSAGSEKLRLYMHSASTAEYKHAVLIINLHMRKAGRVQLSGDFPPARARLVLSGSEDPETPALLSPDLYLNCRILKLEDAGGIPDIFPEEIEPSRALVLPPLSWGIFLLG